MLSSLSACVFPVTVFVWIHLTFLLLPDIQATAALVFLVLGIANLAMGSLGLLVSRRTDQVLAQLSLVQVGVLMIGASSANSSGLSGVHFVILAFGFGVLRSAQGKRSLRFMSLMIFANAVNGLLLWNLFPMHMRGDEISLIDLVLATLAATGGIFGALANGFGAVAFGRRFRLYSIGTIAMMFVPTILVFSFVPQVGANQSSPWMGLLERTAFAVYMQWQIVMAFILLRRGRMIVSEALRSSN